MGTITPWSTTSSSTTPSSRRCIYLVNYVRGRLPSAILILALATIPIFLMLRLAPGDPATVLAGPDATAATLANVRNQLGLDKPLLSQYLSWLNGVAHFDFGTSFATRARVGDLIARGGGATATLALSALVVALLIALPLGIVSATAKSSLVQTIVSAVNVVLLAVPTYVSGVLLVLVFAVTFPILPPGGYETLGSSPVAALQYLAMPTLCLAFPVSAVLARFLGASLQQVFREEHYFAAQLRGVGGVRLMLRHALPNAIGPMVVMLGIQTGQLLGGSVIVEAIFAWPGIGQTLVQASVSRDYPVVQSLLLLAVGVFITLQLLTDLATAAIDPRTRERSS